MYLVNIPYIYHFKKLLSIEFPAKQFRWGGEMTDIANCLDLSVKLGGPT